MNKVKTLAPTKRQQEFLPAIRWLVSDEIGSGRSYLLALCFLDKAMTYPGKPVYVFDHLPTKVGTTILLAKITQIFVEQGFSQYYKLQLTKEEPGFYVVPILNHE